MNQPDSSTVADTPLSPAKGGRRPLGRAVQRFLDDPSSGRNAILLIVAANLATVLIGGTIIWLVDGKEFSRLTEAFWYILQTVTTVGYGDVTPTDPAGRLVGAVVMLLGLAFMSILTAAITSSFLDARQVERRARREAEQDARWLRLEGRFDELIERLDRLDANERSGRERPTT